MDMAYDVLKDYGLDYHNLGRYTDLLDAWVYGQLSEKAFYAALTSELEMAVAVLNSRAPTVSDVGTA